MKQFILTVAALITATAMKAETNSLPSSVTNAGVTYQMDLVNNKAGAMKSSAELITLDFHEEGGTLTMKSKISQSRTDTLICNAIPTAVEANKVTVDLSDFSFMGNSTTDTIGDLINTVSYAYGTSDYSSYRAMVHNNYRSNYPSFCMTWKIMELDEDALKKQYGENYKATYWVWYNADEEFPACYETYTNLQEFYAATSGQLVGYWRKISEKNGKISIYYHAIQHIAVAEQTVTTVTNLYDYQVTEIQKNGAFEGNTNIQSVNLGKAINYIEAGAFQGCSNLNTFTTVNDGNYVCVNDILYNKSKTSIVAATADVPSQEIPASVKTIGNYAFYNTASPITLISMNKDLQVGSYQNNVTVLSPSATLSFVAAANGGYKVTGNVVQSNFDDLQLEGTYTYVDFTEANILEDLVVDGNDDNTLYYFTTTKEVSGENVVNNGVCEKLHLYDNKQTFYRPTAFTADSAIYERRFSTNWATMCLPFSVSEEEELDMFCGALTNFADGQFSFMYATSIQAYKPYIVRSKTDEAYTIRVKNSNVPATKTAVTTSGVASFVGVFSPVQLTSTENTYFYGLKDCKIVKIAGANVNTFRAYLSIPAEAAVEAARLRFVDAMDNELEVIELEETTGIENLQDKVETDAVYDLNGQRKATVTRGLNITNGKVTIMK